MAIIDRFACTCSLTSPLRRLSRLKMVPWMIGMIVLTSVLASIYAPILYDLLNSKYGPFCSPVQPTTTSVLYIVLIGMMQPIVMLIFVALTYRNVRRSRQRVGGGAITNQNRRRNQFIAMIFSQVFTTAFFSLQWIIMYAYVLIPTNGIRSDDQWSIIIFVLSITYDCYYLNNVKSFYLSMLTSRLFRKTLFKGLIKLLPRRMRPRLQVAPMHFPLVMLTRKKRREA